MLQHDNVPVHKARSIKKGFIESAVEELDWLDAFVSEWEQIPIAMLQHVVKSLKSQKGGSCVFVFYISTLLNISISLVWEMRPMISLICVCSEMTS